MEMCRRKMIRLKDFDYSANGLYYITICSKDRAEIFCKIEGGEVILSEIGEMVKKIWDEISAVEKGVETLDFCVMPNHIHGVLYFDRADAPLGMVVRKFKARVSQLAGHPVWQRNYYEHVIRDEKDYQRIAEYIWENPLNWEIDAENMAVCMGRRRP